ncbi:MAG TPA: hypothetical protein VFV67_01185 [Actinophytocola sp.]|uniref:bestrophin-like domain n=1 Tax=Actinophytocola sp. TaxID=1872138 RepID=UPI002DB6C0DA|nr:hypothetical protein [Actinophytocola sp.]HEU5469238.1 hypothetical protein [Actinophytocola sp.]
MNIYVAGALWVLGVAAVTAVLTILVRRFSKGDENAAEGIGGVFTIVAGVQAVLMAFVLISLFDTVGSARSGSFTEANALVGVYWAGDSLPEPARTQIQELTRSYTNTVIEQEWPSMREGEPVATAGWDQLERIRVTIDSAPTENDWQSDRKTEAASQLWTVYEARQSRLGAAGESGVSAVLWITLLVGSLLTIALPYLFYVPKLHVHIVMIAVLTGTITLLLFSIYQLQNPFGGGAPVDPDAFTAASGQMHGLAT